MPENRNFRLPMYLIGLDAIGAILFALGLLEWVGNMKIVPQLLQFSNYAIAMIVIGIILMLPLILFVIKQLLGKQPREI